MRLPFEGLLEFVCAGVPAYAVGHAVQRKLSGAFAREFGLAAAALPPATAEALDPRAESLLGPLAQPSDDGGGGQTRHNEEENNKSKGAGAIANTTTPAASTTIDDDRGLRVTRGSDEPHDWPACVNSWLGGNVPGCSGATRP